MYWEHAARAITLAEQVLPSLKAFQIARRPKEHGPIDVIVVYSGLAVDVVHYDPYTKTPSPKGRPVEYLGEIDPREALSHINMALREAYILRGAEYRKPEDAWIVPVAWNNMIILHLKISGDGGRLIADPGLQRRLREAARP
ncbi:MAG: hypothetical protein F7C36_06780 [Desulfurococcales archaeon]|nr:hypothetical protein [Desulfurococcales archaeon]